MTPSTVLLVRQQTEFMEVQMNEHMRPRDYVCLGRRWLAELHQMAIAVAVIGEDGQLEATRLYVYTAKLRGKAIGCVYRGAKFGGTDAEGLPAARYERAWMNSNSDTVVGWRALDTAAEHAEKLYKVEQDTRKLDPIILDMLRLRRLYEAYRVRRDTAGMMALEVAVLAALKTSPRAGEKSL
jgi:hypothetical protein